MIDRTETLVLLAGLLLAIIGASASLANMLDFHKRRGAIRCMRKQLEKSSGAVAFTTLMARDDSPIPSTIRETARHAYPSWEEFDRFPGLLRVEDDLPNDARVH